MIKKYTPKIEISTDKKSIFIKDPDTDANIVLNVCGIANNQFVDLYIENTWSQGAYLTKLVGKASGSICYSTHSSAVQYLIGSVYIKDSQIVCVDPLYDIVNKLQDWKY